MRLASRAPATSSTRASGTATLLPDGKVLVAGGTDSGALPDSELYDPVTATWMATANLLINSLGGHSATLLPNGKVLVAGGAQYGLFTLTSAELLQPCDRHLDCRRIRVP